MVRTREEDAGLAEGVDVDEDVVRAHAADNEDDLEQHGARVSHTSLPLDHFRCVNHFLTSYGVYNTLFDDI